MNLRPLLLAALAAGLLVSGGGTVAADGAGDDLGGADAGYLASAAAGDVELAGSDVGCADDAGLCTDGDAELPETLPEAIGHLLTLLGGIAEALPSSLGDAVLRLV